MFFFSHNCIPFSSQILVVVIVLDMPVVVLGVVAVYDTTAAGHMNFALIIAHSKHLSTVNSVYLLYEQLFISVPHSLNSAFLLL